MRLVAWRDPEGKLSLAAMLGGPVAEAPAPAVARSPVPAPMASGNQSPAWTTEVKVLELSECSIVLEDRTVRPPARLEIEPLRLMVEDLATKPGSRFSAALDCVINQTGRITLEGEAGVAPALADLELDAENLDVRVIQPYVDRGAQLDLTSGTLEAAGRFQLGTLGEAGPGRRFTGKVAVRDFESTDRLQSERFVAWKSLALNGVELEGAPDRLVVKEVVAVEPYARVIIGADRTVNLRDVLRPASKEPPAPAAQAAQAATAAQAKIAPARIDLIRIEGGSANFSDLSLQPNFSTGIQDITGKVTGLSSALLSRADVSLAGKVDTYAPVSISGQVNFLSGKAYTDLALSFKDIELTTFTPYSGKFAGYRIQKGKLDLDLTYKVEDRELVGENKIFMNQLTLGEKTDSPDATRLPVRLAIALLKDRHGNIDIDLPVKGSLDDPEFSVGKLVFKALLNLVLKAVMSPFALLGGLFGGGEELDHVDFAFGSAELDSAQVQKLAGLHGALVERPALTLEVEGSFDPERDASALARAHLEEQLSAAIPGEPIGMTTDRERLRSLTALYTAKYGPPPKLAKTATVPPTPTTPEELRQLMESRLLADIAVDANELRLLGENRARRIRDSLLQDAQVAPERIFIVEFEREAAAGGEVVAVTLTLDGS